MDPDPGGSKNIWILRIRIRNSAVSTGLYLFQERQKAGEDGEEDEKEADISQSGVGLEHGNQSFPRVLMKKMCKAVRRNNSGNRQMVVEKKCEKTPSNHETRFCIHW
jgi:hypothetical protein